MKYKWDDHDGIVEATTGKQIIQLLAVGCTKKFRKIVGKELTDKLNNKGEVFDPACRFCGDILTSKELICETCDRR